MFSAAESCPVSIAEAACFAKGSGTFHLDGISGTGSPDHSDGGGWGFAGEIESCRDLAALSATVVREVARYGYAAPACGVFKPTEQGSELVYLFRNWPAAWAARYSQRDVAAHDFVVAEARRRLAPYAWSTAKQERQLTRQEQEFWNALTEFGWSDGVAVPIHGPGGHCAFVTMACAQADLTPVLRGWLHALAFLTFERARVLHGVGSEQPPRRILTSREFECLREVGAGKSDREIGATLGIGQTTVKYYLERARLKLGVRTRAQAYARLVLWGED